MAGITDVLPQTAAGFGGFALLVYAVRTTLHVDRPLRRAVDEIQKRLDAERARGDRLDQTVDELRTQLRTERDTAATAMVIQQSLTHQLEVSQERVSSLVDETVGYRKEIETLRDENSRLRGQRR